MKTKRKGKFNMNNQLEAMSPVDKPQADEVDIEVVTHNYDQEFADRIIEYNKNIRNLDPDYAKFKPASYGVLVRAFATEMEITDDGVLIPNRRIVKIPTASGVGFAESIEDPYSFDRKAVVVSVGPDVKNYKPGDIVLLNNEIVKATLLGRGNQVSVYVDKAFVHWDYKSTEFPKDPSSKHYGYLFCYDGDIIGSIDE